MGSDVVTNVDFFSVVISFILKISLIGWSFSVIYINWQKEL